MADLKALAETLVTSITDHYPKYAASAKSVKLVDIDAKQYFGEGYQDVSLRVPSIRHAKQYLNWNPEIDMPTGLKKTLDFYLA